MCFSDLAFINHIGLQLMISCVCSNCVPLLPYLGSARERKATRCQCDFNLLLIQFNLGSIWIQFSQPASMCKCTAQLNITGEINFAMLPSIGYHTLQWDGGPRSWTRAGEIEKSSGANVVSRVICRKVDFMKCNFVWCESSQVVEECSRVVCIWCTERGREWGVGRRVRGESGGGGRVIKRRPVSTNSFSGKGPHWLDRPTQPICNCEIKYTADKLLSSHSSHLATALPRNMSFLLSL